MYPDIHLIIGGKSHAPETGRTIAVLDPATEEVLATLPSAGGKEAIEAARIAQEGFEEWSAIPALDRARVLRRAAELMRERADPAAAVMTLEQGKPLAQARAEWLASSDLLDWFAEEGRRTYGRIIPSRSAEVSWHVHRRPIGPVALLSPWNFPAWAPMQKIAPALAAGCSVVVKPSEETPATAWLIARALLDAGLAPRAISVLWGDPADITSALIAAPEIRKFSLTGSTRVGRIVAAQAGEHLKKVTMELGGHAPVIVAADVDVARLAPLAAQWKFRNAGQVCVSPTRFLVEAEIYDAFVEAFAAEAGALRTGSGLAPDTQMGPLTNARQRGHIEKLVADARQRGAHIASGGERIGNAGYFHAPTVIRDAAPGLAAMNEEPFGPLALVMKVDGIGQALEEANRLPVGLASYAFTNDRAVAREIARNIRAGMLGLNHFALAMPETPFGGVLDSGFGSEGGIEGLDAYLTTHLVTAADGI